MAWYRWKFYDPETTATWTVPINPSSVNEGEYSKNILEESTVSIDGDVMIVEGSDVATTMEFEGTMLTKEHHDAFIEWFRKRYPVRITDDFGYSTWVYITSYSPQRVRSSVQAKRTYTVRAFVLGHE